jgi:HK97 family phage major capsid protein
MAYEELNELRSVEELTAHQRELEDEQDRLDSEYAGLPFPDDVRERYAAVDQLVEEIDRRVRELRARQERAARRATRDDNVERLSFSAKAPGSVRNEDIYDTRFIRNASGDELRDAALRSIDTTRFDNPEAPNNMRKLLDQDSDGSIARRILLTDSPTYKRAFGKYLANRPRTPEEERALSTATNYAVPASIDPTVVLTSNGVLNPVRQIARVITIAGNTWTGVASTGVTASYSAEATEAGDNSPALTQPAANVEKAQAFIKYPLEVGEDWGALQSEMARLLADAKDTLESSKFLTGLGHGSNEPEGLLVGATGPVMTAAASVIAVADLYSLREALAPRWRANASYAGNLAVYDKIRQFDTGGGASLWVQLQFGEPANLIGRPAYEWSDISSAITTGAASVLIFGDFNEFTIVDRVGMNIEVVPHVFATANNRPSGERGLYAYWRNTSDVRTAAAFKTLKITS